MNNQILNLETYFNKIKDSDFPIFQNNSNLIYVDNAATTQKPKILLKTIKDYYENYTSNVHRGIHSMSQKASNLFDKSREKVAKFLNVDFNQIIFTLNATDSINIVAQGLKNQFKQKDQILLSVAEHHANLVVWQQIAKEKDLELVFVNLDLEFRIDLEDLKKKINSKTKLVSLAYVSNVLGVINPIDKIVNIIRKNSSAKILIDGSAQIPHFRINLKELDIDYYVFSAHKIYGPSGVGILSGKKKSLNELTLNKFGGGMIEDVKLDSSTFNQLPYSLEAGTPNIEGIIGFSSVLDYLDKIGFENITKWENELVEYFLKKVLKIKNINIYGSLNPKFKIPLFSFNIANIHSHDISEIFNQHNIAIRSGHHCVMPLHNQILNIISSNRISLGFYNTKKDIDKIIDLLSKIEDIFNSGEFLKV